MADYKPGRHFEDYKEPKSEKTVEIRFIDPLKAPRGFRNGEARFWAKIANETAENTSLDHVRKWISDTIQGDVPVEWHRVLCVKKHPGCRDSPDGYLFIIFRDRWIARHPLTGVVMVWTDAEREPTEKDYSTQIFEAAGLFRTEDARTLTLPARRDYYDRAEWDTVYSYDQKTYDWLTQQARIMNMVRTQFEGIMDDGDALIKFADSGASIFSASDYTQGKYGR